MRAILVGTLNSECATWQATMLTSSACVTAIIMSESPAAARSSTSGWEAKPASVRTSSEFPTWRERSSDWSITVTSLPSEASWRAMW